MSLQGCHRVSCFEDNPLSETIRLFLLLSQMLLMILTLSAMTAFVSAWKASLSPQSILSFLHSHLISNSSAYLFNLPHQPQQSVQMIDACCCFFPLLHLVKLSLHWRHPLERSQWSRSFIGLKLYYNVPVSMH